LNYLNKTFVSLFQSFFHCLTADIFSKLDTTIQLLIAALIEKKQSFHLEHRSAPQIPDDRRHIAHARAAPRSKFDNDDDDYPSTARVSARPTTIRPTTRSTYDDDDEDCLPTARVSARPTTIRPTTRSRFDDDDEDCLPTARVSTRPTARVSTRPTARVSTRPTTRSIYDDDNDYRSPARGTPAAVTRSKYGEE
jgi:hypothetical protein